MIIAYPVDEALVILFLFDLAADPNEETNLATKEIERLKTMRKRWEELAEDYRED